MSLSGCVPPAGPIHRGRRVSPSIFCTTQNSGSWNFALLATTNKKPATGTTETGTTETGSPFGINRSAWSVVSPNRLRYQDRSIDTTKGFHQEETDTYTYTHTYRRDSIPD